MADQNAHFLSALVKLGIPSGDYRNHPDFQALPAAVTSILWNDFKNPPHGLTVFELGALQNARCSTLSQPAHAGATAAAAPAGTSADSAVGKVVAKVCHMQSQYSQRVDVPSSFEAFREACCEAFLVQLIQYGKEFKIYRLPSLRSELSDRQRITADNYVDFVSEWRTDLSKEPYIYIWSAGPHGNSPDANCFIRKEESSERGKYPSSRGYSTTEFRLAIRERYHFHCLACGGDFKNAPGTLDACHLLEVWEINGLSLDDQHTLLTECDLSGIHEDRNFILLCKTCHRHFDNQLLGITRDGTVCQWAVKPELVETQLPHSEGTYGTLVGTPIRFPTPAPVLGVIDYRYKRYLSGRKRKADVLDQLQHETFAAALLEIGCSNETIEALWGDRLISAVTILNRRPNKRSSDWEEIQAPSEAHAHSATFWYNRKTCTIWVKLKGG